MQILANEDCQYFQECLKSHVVVKGPRDNQWRRIKTLYKLFVTVTRGARFHLNNLALSILIKREKKRNCIVITSD